MSHYKIISRKLGACEQLRVNIKAEEVVTFLKNAAKDNCRMLKALLWSFDVFSTVVDKPIIL